MYYVCTVLLQGIFQCLSNKILINSTTLDFLPRHNIHKICVTYSIYYDCYYKTFVYIDSIELKNKLICTKELFICQTLYILIFFF